MGGGPGENGFFTNLPCLGMEDRLTIPFDQEKSII
jgi:hypothetical protein